MQNWTAEAVITTMLKLSSLNAEVAEYAKNWKWGSLVALEHEN